MLPLRNTKEDFLELDKVTAMFSIVLVNKNSSTAFSNC